MGFIQRSHLAVLALKNSSGIDYTQDANCMGAWYMNNNGGDETDRSGEGETLTQASGTIPTSATVPSGYSGTSRDFEAGDTEHLSHVDEGSTEINGANQAITLAAWVKLESLSADGVAISKWDTGSERQYRLYYESSDSKLYFVLSDNGTNETNCVSNTSFSGDTDWHHIAAVYNDTDMRIYIDGSLDSNGADNPKTYSAGIDNSTSQFRLGADINGNRLDGLLDEVAIFDRELSSTEISNLYNDGISGNKGGND